ncbi:MAG: GatB/YqeY domain-containing protein [Thiogranum sp.]|nr:GatB/YqeY domain-containing protein [Thiogranum sp.]
MSVKDRLQQDMKDAMRAGDKRRLGVIRLILAAVKQREVDERIELDDEQMLMVLDKMAKQRRESVEQYARAGRDDLVDQENFELEVLKTYLPEQLSDAEVDTMIGEAIQNTGAASMKDMGKVMGELRSKLQGRADMSAVSARIKARLGA